MLLLLTYRSAYLAFFFRRPTARKLIPSAADASVRISCLESTMPLPRSKPVTGMIWSMKATGGVVTVLPPPHLVMVAE